MTDQDPKPTEEARFLLGSILRREGYAYADVEAALDHYCPEISNALAAARAEGERAGAEAERKAVVARLRSLRKWVTAHEAADDIEARANTPGYAYAEEKARIEALLLHRQELENEHDAIAAEVCPRSGETVLMAVKRFVAGAHTPEKASK